MIVVVIWGTPQFHLIIQIMSLFSICKLLYVIIHSFGGHQFLGVTFLDAYSTTGGMFISEKTAKKHERRDQKNQSSDRSTATSVSTTFTAKILTKLTVKYKNEICQKVACLVGRKSSSRHQQ